MEQYNAYKIEYSKQLADKLANGGITAPLPNAVLCGVIKRPLWLSKKEAEFAHSIKTLHFQASRYLLKIAEKHISNPIEWSIAYLDRGVL